jgi:putative endonuclease
MNNKGFMADRIERGRLAEQLAVSQLTGKGYRVLARNWRCRYGEIDIVAEYNGAIVFVEVRSRTSRRFGTALEAIDWKKQQKVRSIAAFYLNFIGNPDQPVRFDAIVVQWNRPPEQYELLHLEGVF